METHTEVTNLTQILMVLDDVGMKMVFPKLTTLAVAAIYGKETNRWLETESYWAKKGVSDFPTLQCMSVFH